VLGGLASAATIEEVGAAAAAGLSAGRRGGGGAASATGERRRLAELVGRRGMGEEEAHDGVRSTTGSGRGARRAGKEYDEHRWGRSLPLSRDRYMYTTMVAAFNMPLCNAKHVYVHSDNHAHTNEGCSPHLILN
jgi:hypothetical protein